MTIFGLPIFPIVLIVAGVIDLIIALGIHLFLDRFRKKADVIRRKWRPIQVKILSSRVVEKPGEELPVYSAEVRYEYTVEGTRYESDRISIFPTWSSSVRSQALDRISGFVAGREVSGWVNPWDLKEAVLDATAVTPQGLRLVVLVLVGTGIVTLVAAAVVWIAGVGSPA